MYENTQLQNVADAIKRLQERPLKGPHGMGNAPDFYAALQAFERSVWLPDVMARVADGVLTWRDGKLVLVDGVAAARLLDVLRAYAAAVGG